MYYRLSLLYRIPEPQSEAIEMVFLSFLPCRKLPYDVSSDQALEHVEVRMRIGHTIQHLRTISDQFQQAICEAVEKMP